MKKTIRLLSILSAIGLIISCSESEPEPIVAIWVLDDITYTNAPSGFELQNGSASSLYGETEYKIRFFDDGTYERDVENVTFTSGAVGDVGDEGMYELSDDELILDATSGDTEAGLDVEFDVIAAPDDRNLVLQVPTVFTAWPDYILEDEVALDTVDTQEEFDDLAAEHAAVISMDIELAFDREN